MADKARTRASTGTTAAGPPGGVEQNRPTLEESATGAVCTMATQTDTDGVLSKLLAKMEVMERQNTTILETEEKHRKDMVDEMSRITTFMDENRKAWNTHQRKLAITERQLATALEVNKRLEAKINTMDNRMRICNIRVDGKAEDENENLPGFVLDLARQIGVNHISPSDIVSSYRMGKRAQGRNGGRARTIMVTFLNERVRNQLYYARTNLRNLDRYRGIYLNDDVTQLTRKYRDEYRSVATLARSQGSLIRMHDDGVIIDEQKYLLGEAHLLPDHCSLAKARTVQINGEIYFASEHSFLSNFAPSPIFEDDVLYPTGEHLYQALKCSHANEPGKLGMVIAAPTPLAAKRIADSIKETPEWRNERDKIMKRVVELKFDQNPDLAELLRNTGNLPLNEATHNEHYGIGAAIHSKEVKDKSYRGGNKLGIMLMEKRTQIMAN